MLVKELQTLDANSPLIAEKVKQFKEQSEHHEAAIKPFMEIVNHADVQLCITNKTGSDSIYASAVKQGLKNLHLDACFKYAKFQYECGSYKVASDMLNYFLLMSTNTDQAQILASSWGKLAADICAKDWTVAEEEVYRLRDFIDTKSSLLPVEQLQQRTWLLHWSMLVIFKRNRGEEFIDFCFQSQYLNAIQTSCPHLLRYLSAACVNVKRRRTQLKELVKIIALERYEYKDPVTEFLHNLYNECDFDAARLCLQQCQDEILKQDFFLHSISDDFVYNARVLMFEVYTHIHSIVEISALADLLTFKNTQEGQEWVVNFAKKSRPESVTDLENDVIVMNTEVKTTFAELMEQTKELDSRQRELQATLEKLRNNTVEV